MSASISKNTTLANNNNKSAQRKGRYLGPHMSLRQLAHANEIVTCNKGFTQGGGRQVTAVPDNVASSEYFVDVLRNCGVGADRVLIHETDQIALG